MDAEWIITVFVILDELCTKGDVASINWPTSAMPKS